MLIKISDTYKDGWQVVKEYESDKLASNSEDEKKIKKAKEAAGRKRKARQEDKQCVLMAISRFKYFFRIPLNLFLIKFIDIFKF